jgi:hypothetical protein
MGVAYARPSDLATTEASKMSENILGVALGGLSEEITRLKSEKMALEAKVNALRLTEAELTERIGDHMKNLEIKKQVEALQQKVRDWLRDER